MLIAAVLIAASLSAAAPAAAGPPAPPDGTYKYSITQSGDQIGESLVTVKRSADGIALHETETLGELGFTVDETVDPATLGTRTYTATYTKGTASQTVHVVIDRNGATVTFDGVPGNSVFGLPAGVKNAYVLESAIMTGFLMLPAQIHASGASQFLQVIPSEGLQLTSRVSSSATGARPPSVPQNDASLSVASQVSLDEWYDPRTFVLDAVSVPVQGVLISLTK